MLALALVLIAPVTGSVAREFDPGRPFEAGGHRGADFAAAVGTPVRAACGGRVAFAGRIGGTGVVTVRCGRWPVTHLPLATITARGFVARGAPIGTVGPSSQHRGLHLGVRRDGTRFGYADPLRFLSRPGHPVPLGRAPRGQRPRRPPGAVPRSVRPPPAPIVRPPPAAAPGIAPAPPTASPPLAPWPAWAGLALALAGLSLRVRIRTRSAVRRRGSVAA